MLTPAQQDAVRRSGQDVCVVAGPGSGKTRVLIERFAWLVEQRGIAPSRILAITFTEKAATEIKARLIERFSERPEVREAIEHAWVSTIDGFCARLLQENAIAAGLPPGFGVLDASLAARLARESAEEALDGLFREWPAEMRTLLEALDLATAEGGPQPDLARSLLDVYETMRVSGVGEVSTPADDGRARAEARDLARRILDDTTTGKTDSQILGHASLREWAEGFLALPEEPVTVESFRSIALKVNLNHLVKGSAAREAAVALRETLPQLEGQLLAASNAQSLLLLREAVSRIDRLFREKKRRESMLDFGDLEQEAIRLLESDDAVRRETAHRFDQILMDELQDTNRLQWRLVNLIRRSFFAVGDINQSIYGFRHADPAVFEDYRNSLTLAGGVVDCLTENHRSRQDILSAVTRALDGQPGIEPRPLTAAKQFPALTGPVVERIVGQGEEGSAVEAGLVAARIREWVDGGERAFSDIAVLVRALRSATPFERAFDQFKIPFLTSGGRTFLETREILDLLALLAALVNPLDEIALAGVLRGPLAGIGDEDLFRMGPDGWAREFQQRFGRLRDLSGFLPPDRLLAIALDETGYVAGLPDRARANIEKFLGHVRRAHHQRPRALAEVLEDLEALRSTPSEAEAPPPEAGNLVRLMTIHAAKGLEFPVVFVSALHRGTERRRPAIAFSPASGLGAKWRHPVSGQGQSDGVHRRILDDLKRREDDEENRLLYVAMTRAEDRLILSYAERRQRSSWQKLVEAAVPDCTASDQPPAATISPRAAQEPGTVEELLPPPMVLARHDGAAAITSVAMFHACPRRYYLSRYLGIEPDYDRPPTGGVALGLAVHQILAGGTADDPEALDLASRFTASGLGQRARRASRIEQEFDFLLPVEDVVLRGQIDLWFEEAGELLLVDYKTDREESPESYELQLRLYALAVERYAGRLPDRAVLYYLRSDRAVEVSLAAHELEAANNTVREFLAAQDAMEFTLKVGHHCRSCVFLGNRCPAVL